MAQWNATKPDSILTDYDETSSPVVRFKSVRTVIALEVQNGLKLHQIAAFLNGELEEEVCVLWWSSIIILCPLKRRKDGLYHGFPKKPGHFALMGDKNYWNFASSAHWVCMWCQVWCKSTSREDSQLLHTSTCICWLYWLRTWIYRSGNCLGMFHIPNFCRTFQSPHHTGFSCPGSGGVSPYPSEIACLTLFATCQKSD